MPDREERKRLIEGLEEARGGTVVITYLTSTRGGLEAQMAMDAVPYIYRHLRLIETPKEETKIDLFLHSNGGDGIVPWRLTSLLREFSTELTVLVPHRAFSAATLAALGADRVIMHPMGMLGPIDPSVTTPYNPPDPGNPAQRLQISVEDVASYINLVKADVGIQHEDELVQAFALLAQEVHPLALGAVKRATAQSRMMGEKLLRQRARAEEDDDLDEHDVEEILDKLTTQLHYHGHPINRQEAQDDLRLGFVEKATNEVETAIWALYDAYAEEMRLDVEFQPAQEAYAQNPIAPPAPPGAVAPGQFMPSVPTVAVTTIGPLIVAAVESRYRCDLRTIEFEVTSRREWTGDLNATVTVTGGSWTADEAVG